MDVVPEGGMHFYWNLNEIIDGHTTIEHSIPMAPLFNDVVCTHHPSHLSQSLALFSLSFSRFLSRSLLSPPPPIIARVLISFFSGNPFRTKRDGIHSNPDCKLWRYLGRKLLVPTHQRMGRHSAHAVLSSNVCHGSVRFTYTPPTHHLHQSHPPLHHPHAIV